MTKAKTKEGKKGSVHIGCQTDQDRSVVAFHLQLTNLIGQMSTFVTKILAHNDKLRLVTLGID